MSEVRAGEKRKAPVMVEVRGRMRNGPLCEAAQKLGGMGKLAEHLGLSRTLLSYMVNLGWSPDVKKLRAKGHEKWFEIERKLYALTGLLLEDIFPEELLTSEFAERRRKPPRMAAAPKTTEGDGAINDEFLATEKWKGPIKVSVNGHMRNGALYQAAQKLGGIGRLAKHLGLTYPITIAMINLRWSPDAKKLRAEGNERWQEIERKLCALTGLLLEDIFPEERKFTRIAEVPLLQLAEAPRTLLLPPAQEESLLQEDLRAMITAALAELDEREQEVIELRFGLNGEEEHTLDEIGVRLGVTWERARQIEAKALGRLRHPVRAKKLKPFYEAA